MPKNTWSNYKRSGIWVDPPPCFFKIPTFSRYFFWGASLNQVWVFLVSCFHVAEVVPWLYQTSQVSLSDNITGFTIYKMRLHCLVFTNLCKTYFQIEKRNKQYPSFKKQISRLCNKKINEGGKVSSSEQSNTAAATVQQFEARYLDIC